MSIDPRDVLQPDLTTIYLSGGHFEVSASPPTLLNGSPQDFASAAPSTGPISASPPSLTSTPSFPHDHSGHEAPHEYTPQTTRAAATPTSTATYVGPFETSPTVTIFPSDSAGVVSSDSVSNSHGLRGLSLAAVITLPILALIVVPSILFLCCRTRQRKARQCRRGVPDRPHQTSLVASIKSSFNQHQETSSVRSSQHSAYFPAVPVSRDPSPTPETRVRPNLQSLGLYRSDTVVLDPPPPYVPPPDSLRPPTMYGRIHTRSPSPTLSEANLLVHNEATLRSPFGSPFLDLEADALSDVSFERGFAIRRHRDVDEVSFVSALEPEEHAVERDLHYVV